MELAKDFPVWVSDVGNLGDALGMIEKVGELCCRKEQASKLISDIKQAFKAVLQAPPLKTLSTAFFSISSISPGSNCGNSFIQSIMC